MVAVTPFLLSLPALSLALAIPPSGSQILSDLQQLTSDFNALTAADRSYASTGDASAVQGAVDQVALDNEQTFADATTAAATTATGSASVSDSDAAAIVAYIGSGLEPAVAAAINATVANKARVDATPGVAAVLAAELVDLRADNDRIGAALAAALPAADGPALQAGIAKIDADYDYGISQFS